MVAFGTEGADVTDEVTEAFCEIDSSSSSVSSDPSSSEVMEPGSDGIRSAKSSPRNGTTQSIYTGLRTSFIAE